MPDHKSSYIKQLLIQVGGGASAGFVEASIMHPLDLVKTRMQLQNARAPVMINVEQSHLYYNGIVDCFQKMYKHEGVFSFWKGIIPPIVAETPKRAVKFLTFEQYKEFFSFGKSSRTPSVYVLAGASAGVTEAIVVNPFEVVKVSLQSDRNKLKLSPSTWAVTKKIWQNGGLGPDGLFKGLSGTVWRNGLFNMVYFGFYNSVIDLLPKVNDSFGEFFKKFITGFAAGTLASCVNIPFDVAKSRIQGPQPISGEVKYKKLFPTLKIIYIEEGWRAWYKGLLPKVMRLGPGGAIMMVVYDYVTSFLRIKFQD